MYQNFEQVQPLPEILLRANYSKQEAGSLALNPSSWPSGAPAPAFIQSDDCALADRPQGETDRPAH